MIPKIIHYCWFGRTPKPKLAEKCIASWKKYCPDYQIREWNEDNYDLSNAPLYVREAYSVKKWAFVSDFVRLDVVVRYGGYILIQMWNLSKKLMIYYNINRFSAHKTPRGNISVPDWDLELKKITSVLL